MLFSSRWKNIIFVNISICLSSLKKFGWRDANATLGWECYLGAQNSVTCSVWMDRDSWEAVGKLAPQWQRFLCCPVICPRHLEQRLAYSKSSLFWGWVFLMCTIYRTQQKRGRELQPKASSHLSKDVTGGRIAEVCSVLGARPALQHL